MAKHTPGPWHLSSSRRFVRKTDDSPGWPDWNIAEVNDQVDGWEDNARLLAAAPDLRAALAGAADALHECAKMLRQMGCPGHATVADVHQEAARAALTKADGE
jgi:hypothetical protein